MNHAENAIQSAININPNSGKILCTAASVYEQIGLIDKAKETFQTAVKVNPSEVDNDCRFAASYGKYGGEALEGLVNVLKETGQCGGAHD